jgi:hypothetical protein
MSDWKLRAPVAFLIFNRPDTTEQVFAEIARSKPPRLLVVADGPRPERPGEAERCAAARAIIEQVDWDCEVLTNYSEINLGCKNRISSGLDWVFNTVEEAIILEDDCLPHPTFFRFCEELLAKYRNDSRIMQICGFNPLHARQVSDYSYYYARYGKIWGWASWKRAWSHYDVSMKLWDLVKKEKIYNFYCDNRRDFKWQFRIFEKTFRGEIETWCYPWHFARRINHGLSIIPHGNLISNIGFGPYSTHYFDPTSYLANLKLKAIEFPLKHPPYLLRNKTFDDMYVRNIVYYKSPFPIRVRRLVKRYLSRIGRKIWLRSE